jgi:hypothetical protein
MLRERGKPLDNSTYHTEYRERLAMEELQARLEKLPTHAED